MKRKITGISKLQKELDKYFSYFIRLRDSDSNGMCKCFTCSKVAHWKELHCGHYISRRHLSTRWEEKNCNAQCPGCNLFNQGAGDQFALGLIRVYGSDILEFLNIKKNNKMKLGRFEYEILIQEYKDKVDKLKKEKGL